MTSRSDHTFRRPEPPADLRAPDKEGGVFVRAEEVEAWIAQAILDPSGPLFNPDHLHLELARIAVMWTNIPGSRKGKMLGGTAEIPFPRGGSWAKERQQYQLREWFGEPGPDFLLTLFAPYAAACSDAAFCALVEHEMYHCAQARDEFGSPRFNSITGMPIWTIVGHDVEEFVGVVRRYGARAGAGETHALVQAALREPEIEYANVEIACGTCLRAAA